jgi:tetraspanin-32
MPHSHALGLPHLQLLGLSVATMAAFTHFGDQFAVISHASLERNPYQAMDHWGK